MRFPVSQDAQDALADSKHQCGANHDGQTLPNIARPITVPTAPRRPTLQATPAPIHIVSVRGDELRVMVWSDPERTQAAGTVGSDTERGIIVNEQGQFFYPFVGAVRASGRSTSQIRADLTDQLRNFIADPQVEVSVLRFNAHQATVTGVVGAPGPVTITNCATALLDVLNQAGMTADGDLSNVLVRRKGAAYNVNLKAFIDHGDSRRIQLFCRATSLTCRPCATTRSSPSAKSLRRK